MKYLITTLIFFYTTSLVLADETINTYVGMKYEKASIELSVKYPNTQFRRIDKWSDEDVGTVLRIDKIDNQAKIIVAQVKRNVVPNVVGLHATDAVRLLDEEGFRIEENYVDAPCDADINHVAKQSPQAGEVVNGVRPMIELAINQKQRILLPDVTGLTVSQVDQVLAVFPFKLHHDLETQYEQKNCYCGESTNHQVTVYKHVLRTLPAAGSNMACLGTNKVTTFRRQYHSHECRFTVHPGNCP